VHVREGEPDPGRARVRAGVFDATASAGTCAQRTTSATATSTTVIHRNGAAAPARGCTAASAAGTDSLTIDGP
jgi:hypothetical protein